MQYCLNIKLKFQIRKHAHLIYRKTKRIYKQISIHLTSLSVAGRFTFVEQDGYLEYLNAYGKIILLLVIE